MYRYLGVLQKVFGGRHRPGAFDSFNLSGDSTLQSLAHFYGLEFAVPDPHMTVAEYLTRSCYGQPRTGDRALLSGKVELVVRDIEDGRIRTVCLRILGSLPERRGPWPFEGAHNFMRRSTDRERDRRASPTEQRRSVGRRRSAG